MFNWIKNVWNKFHNWVATWAPGVKTATVTALGAMGSFAGVMQEYVSGLPLDRFVTATQALIITTVLFSLAFWFRMLTNRAPAA